MAVVGCVSYVSFNCEEMGLVIKNSVEGISQNRLSYKTVQVPLQLSKKWLQKTGLTVKKFGGAKMYEFRCSNPTCARNAGECCGRMLSRAA